jgi:hypothetical protein
MTSVLLSTVVPAFGALISLAMYGVPLMAVQKVASNKTLGVRVD